MQGLHKLVPNTVIQEGTLYISHLILNSYDQNAPAQKYRP